MKRFELKYFKIILVMFMILVGGINKYDAKAAIGDTIKQTFPDANLAQLIANQYANSNVNAIFDNAMANQRYLNFARQNISNMEGIQFFTNVEFLDLSNNNIGQVINNISDLKKLIRLNLSHNGISLLPNSLVNLPSLIDLSIRDNNFTSFPSVLINLTNLEVLDIGSNKINVIPDDIGKMKNLVILDLYHTDLSKVPDTIGNLTKLNSLTIEGNKQLTTLPNTIGNLLNLRNLGLSNNNLKSLPDSITNLNKLQWLLVRYNNLSKIPNNFNKLKSLEVLDFSNNKFTSISSDMTKLVNIRSLNLENNNISVIPTDIDKLKNLHDVSFKNNKIKLIPDSIANLSSLKFLGLANNQIEAIPDSLTKLKNLNSIALESNNIHKISPTTFQFVLNVGGLVGYYDNQNYSINTKDALIANNYQIKAYSTYALTNNPISFTLEKPDGTIVKNANVRYNGSDIIVDAKELVKEGKYKLTGSIANVKWVYTYNFKVVKNLSVNNELILPKTGSSVFVIFNILVSLIFMAFIALFLSKKLIK